MSPFLYVDGLISTYVNYYLRYSSIDNMPLNQWPPLGRWSRPTGGVEANLAMAMTVGQHGKGSLHMKLLVATSRDGRAPGRIMIARTQILSRATLSL